MQYLQNFFKMQGYAIFDTGKFKLLVKWTDILNVAPLSKSVALRFDTKTMELYYDGNNIFRDCRITIPYEIQNLANINK